MVDDDELFQKYWTNRRTHSDHSICVDDCKESALCSLLSSTLALNRECTMDDLVRIPDKSAAPWQSNYIHYRPGIHNVMADNSGDTYWPNITLILGLTIVLMAFKQ